MSNSSKSNAILMGHVSTRSGLIMLIDMGYLNWWSHDQAPHAPEWLFENERYAHLQHTAVDFFIEGKDANLAGLEFNRCANFCQGTPPTYIFDVLEPMIPQLHEEFEALCRKMAYRARLKQLSSRISHRRRVDLAVDNENMAGLVSYHGISAIAASGIQLGRKIPVYGVKMDSEDYSDRWEEVYLEVNSNTEIARTQNIGTVCVDWARLMFVDVDALGQWQHEESLDRKADLIFWGRDAERIAVKHHAGHIDDQFGWRNISVEKAVNLGLILEEEQKNPSTKFAIDFRPHSHHYEVMKQVRSSEAESATFELAGTELCAFMTSWGDGFFPVICDYASTGEIVRIRVVFWKD